MLKIMLSDDHQVVRRGIKSILDEESDFEVVGEASDGLQTVRLAEKLQPDILILDLMMSGINGLEVTRQLNRKCPQISIIVLSMHSNEAYVLEALRCGAKAYILKDNSIDDLVNAVREVSAGRRYLSPQLSEKAIQVYTQKADAAAHDPLKDLTSREREVFQLAVEGSTNAEIAERLFVSPRTVEVHRSNLMHKLGIRSQTEMVKYAALRGLILSNMVP